ncbi:hypothetical protein Pfo_024837 [Paulownia fortunei]|nr:hypothetical protein Pfo_024837 [Paulownia fortunei]
MPEAWEEPLNQVLMGTPVTMSILHPAGHNKQLSIWKKNISEGKVKEMRRPISVL